MHISLSCPEIALQQNAYIAEPILAYAIMDRLKAYVHRI